MYAMIRQIVSKIVKGDGANYPSAGVSYKGKDTDAVRQSVYGVCSNPPTGSNGLLFQVDGSNGIKYAILDFMTGRFKNLESGEVQIGNYVTRASIKFDKDGDVTIDVPSGNLIANVSGDMTADVDGTTDITTDRLNISATSGSYITGNLNVTGDVTANDFISSGISVAFNAHIHTGDSGGSTSTPQ